jgi:hypothetical protein
MFGVLDVMNLKRLIFWLVLVAVLTFIAGSVIGILTFDVEEAARSEGEIRLGIVGYRDVHGCLAADGYAWCKEKNRCIDLAEEECS